MPDWFEQGDQYAEMLRSGIRLSGEEQEFFIAGRIRHLREQLPPSFQPRRILDFGCGTGLTARRLSETFPQAEIVAADTAENTLAWAKTKFDSPRISFLPVQTMSLAGSFDLCYTNGVFHHIHPVDRASTLRRIHSALAPGAYFALFENNPWNPGTRMVMSRIPFDRDAIPIAPSSAPRLVRQAGFRPCGATRFLFYFPRPLAALRFLEPWLSRIPLGAQYCVLAIKPQMD